MFSVLLRLKNGLPLFLLLLLAALPGRATHLYGGEMSYRYLGPSATAGLFRYEITVLVYVNAGTSSQLPPAGRPAVRVGFYNRPAPGELLPNDRLLTVSIPRVSFRSATPVVPNCPGVPPAPPVNLVKYMTEVELPLSVNGYRAFFTEAARNVGITNIAPRGGGMAGESGNMTLYLDVAAPVLPNASPIFTDTAVAVICQGQTSIIVNNAVDPDGDRLTYAFGTPYAGTIGNGQALPGEFTPPPPAISYPAGYSATQPFGPGLGNFAVLNANTGISQYSAMNAGSYVVAVDVSEFRRINGREVLIGTTRRDIQLITRVCPPSGGTPALTLTAPRSFTIEEGQPLSFAIAATSTPNATPVTLRVNSVLLDGDGDGSGGYNAAFNGQPGVVATGQPTGLVSLTGTGAAGADFTFTPRCGDARATPYDIVVTATNQDCGRRSVSDVFRVTVTRGPGPNALLGDARVCVPGSLPRTYSAGGPVPASYRWRATGGTLLGSATGPGVQVQWGAASGTGRLVVVGYSALGCPTDSAVRLVELRPAAPVNITAGANSICLGASTTLDAAVAGAPASQTYTYTGGGQTLSGARVTVSPTETTTYTVTSLDPASDACPSTGQITVTVTPFPLALTGPALTLCAGVSGQLGAPPVAGVAYQWSPATGLSNPNIANPTLTLPNAGGTALTATYQLRATTGPGCASTASVAITVNAAAVAVTGPALTLCSGTTGQLGTAPVPGTRYRWSPAEGLSDPAAANPTVTLTNPTGANRSQTYTLTATTAFGCTATAATAVTVNPAVVALPALPVAVCSGETIRLGGPAEPGYTYLWSPATGLSSPTVSNPTLSLPNLGDAPLTVTYTLTITTPEGCALVSTVPVTVNPAAVVDAGADAALCADQTLTLGSPARPGYAYLWSPATGLSSATVARPVLTARNATDAPLNVLYQLRATTALGCVATDEVVVTVNPRPAAVGISGPASVCPTVTGVAYSVLPAPVAGGAGLTYEWRIRGGEITGGQGTAAITVSWGPARDDARLQVLVRNAQTTCESDLTTLPVRINLELQTARPTGPLRVCQADGPFTYQTIFTTGSVYTWNIVGGTQLSASGSSVTVRWDRVGLGQLTVLETSNPSAGIRCLGQSETVNVQVLPSPLANLTIEGPNQACENSGLISYRLPGFVTADVPPSTFAFTLNGAAIPATVNQATISTANLAPGTYTLTARETTVAGCVGPLYTRTFRIDPRPVTTIVGPAFVCPEGLTEVGYFARGEAASPFVWAVTGGSIVSGQGTSSIKVTFTADNSPKTLTAVNTSLFGCEGAPVSLTVLPDQAAVALRFVSVDPLSNSRVLVNFAARNLTNNRAPLRLLRRPAGTTDAYALLASLPNTSTSYVDATAQASQQAYDYKIELTNACNTLLDTEPAHTSIRLQVAGTPSPGGREPGRTTLTWSAYRGFGVQEYRVFRVADNGTPALLGTVPAAGPLTLTAPTGDRNAATSFGRQQCYYVEAVQGPNTGGTSLTSRSNRECVDVDGKLAFYNIITPNRDGLNDVLTIANAGLYPGNQLSIFNRWGKQVYQTTNYRNDWGGDDKISAGVYYYLFKLPDGTQNKGWFEVVR